MGVTDFEATFKGICTRREASSSEDRGDPARSLLTAGVSSMASGLLRAAKPAPTQLEPELARR